MRVLFILPIILFIILVVIFVQLYFLKNSISSYKKYWQSRAQEQGNLTLVVLGDSAAQAIGASKPEQGYVGQIASKIERTSSKKVRVVNLSVSGARVKDVIDTQLPLLSKYNPDIVIVEVGGNDVANVFNAKLFEEQYETLAKALPKETIVANIPYFGGRIRKNSEAIIASTIIAQLAEEHNLNLVDLQDETKKNDSWLNYSIDLFHPNNRGYEIWQNAFWPAVVTKITEK
ncbi:SGNH/GDSL hydrolase family protein [Candidatus Saccharibacteria bacterium]|nr:SGNH/GDSL hydrolase family protein [Candidatus Saccharibacteria bacterium]